MALVRQFEREDSYWLISSIMSVFWKMHYGHNLFVCVCSRWLNQWNNHMEAGRCYNCIWVKRASISRAVQLNFSHDFLGTCSGLTLIPSNSQYLIPIFTPLSRTSSMQVLLILVSKSYQKFNLSHELLCMLYPNINYLRTLHPLRHYCFWRKGLQDRYLYRREQSYVMVGNLASKCLYDFRTPIGRRLYCQRPGEGWVLIARWEHLCTWKKTESVSGWFAARVSFTQHEPEVFNDELQLFLNTS